MSASPADHTPGRTPGRTPNGAGPQLIRKPKGTADPLVRPKDRNKRKVQRPTSAADGSLHHSNASTLSSGHSHIQNGLKAASSRATTPSLARPQGSKDNATSGFSSAPLAQFTDYPIILTKKALLEGMRHHVARFSSKKKVDPRDENDFVRPVRLHRRDPRALRNGSFKAEDDKAETPGDDKAEELKAMAKAERDARRQAEMALVAPAATGNQGRKIGVNFRKTEQVMKNDLTDEQKAKSKLRYEEALPWHIEDFDNKSSWMGTYEAALSEAYAMMVQGPDGAFRVAPLEKWYKFMPKVPFKTISAEEAEMRFKKKVKEPRWFADSEEAQKRKQVEIDNRRAMSGLFIGKWERNGGGSGSTAPITKQENPDADDLDFTEDRFADDEENMLFEEDEETKEAEERIKRDQLQANIFDLKEEKEYEKQEQWEQRNKEAEKKLGKRVKKALMKREKNFIYDSDSAENPYSESSASDSDSTEAERLKNEEQDKTKAADGSTSTPEKPLDRNKSRSKPSSALGSGANTPSHRASKHQPSAPISRVGSSSNLKWPGSPVESDASGNESGLRKPKKSKGLTASSSTMSLGGLTSVPSKRARAGSGSDSEGGAGSGGELSDGTRKRPKLRLTFGSRDASPETSRAGSPTAMDPAQPSATGSQMETSGTVPDPNIAPTSNAATPDAAAAAMPSAAEIRARIPASGISISSLLACFRGRITGQEQHKEFTRLMKGNAKFDKERRILLPLN